MSIFLIAQLSTGGAQASDAALSFGPPTGYPVGTPGALASGDLDEDGYLDLVVTNTDTATVSVLLGIGDGSFGAATSFPVGARPGSVAIGDLNDDGVLDLAVANLFGHNVSVLLGAGDGSFSAATAIDGGLFPTSVAIGDLNADGQPDLAVANYNDFTVSVLLGAGDGSFAPREIFYAGWFPSSVAIGDLDSDGQRDLVVANNVTATISVLRGTGGGFFGPVTSFPTEDNCCVAVAIGDLDGDGNLDLVVSNNGAQVLLGDGTGSFGPATSYPTGGVSGYYPIAIGDINGDGTPDLAVSNTDDTFVSVLLGNGDGSFTAAGDFPASYVWGGIVIGDLGGDGRPDIAVGNHYRDTVSVLLNETVFDQTPPTVTATPSIPANENGWNKTDVTVSYRCTDEDSGVDESASSLGDDLLSASGTATGTCVDNEGNSATATYTDQIDKVAPELSASVSPDPVILNGVGIASAGATDDLSGVDTGHCSPVKTDSVGTQSVTCTATDRAGNTATASTDYLVYAFAPSGGSFVIGDMRAAGTVAFWGAKWSKENILTGGGAPSSFKGFAKNPAAPTCGSIWSTDPSNSSSPPSGPLPAYMGVIVTASSAKSGSTIIGDTVKIVVVKPTAGYDSNPGHAGTGVVVATVC